MGKSLFGPNGVCDRSTSSAHWKKNHSAAELPVLCYVCMFVCKENDDLALAELRINRDVLQTELPLLER